MIKIVKNSSHMHEHNTLISSISAPKTDIQYLLLFQCINSLALDSSFCSFLKQLSFSLLLEKKCVLYTSP